jgi:hypothetical protein
MSYQSSLGMVASSRGKKQFHQRTLTLTLTLTQCAAQLDNAKLSRTAAVFFFLYILPSHASGLTLPVATKDLTIGYPFSN